MKSGNCVFFLLLLIVPLLSFSQTTAELTLQLSHADGCTRLGPGVTASAVDTLRGQVYTGTVDTVTGMVQFQALSTPVHDHDPEGLSIPFSLGSAYPNPAKGVVRYPLSVDKSGDVTVEFFNTLGRLVAEKTYNNVQAGEYSIVFDAGDLSTGMYLYRARKDGEVTGSGKTLVLPGSEEFNLAKGRFAQSLEPAEYSDMEWHSSKPALRKGLLEQGVEYNIEIDGDYLEKLSFNVTVDKDTTIERVVQGILEGYLQDASFDEAGEDTQELNFNSPWGSVGYEAMNTNDSLLVEIVDGNKRRVRGAHGDVNGSYSDTLAVVGPHGRRMKKGFTAYINAQPDVEAVLLGPVLKTAQKGVKTYFNGQEAVSDTNGKVKIQLTPGSYVMKTDTSGKRMQTELDLGILGTEDVDLDTIPVAYKSENNTILINAKWRYGKGDGRTYTENKKWNPDKVYAEGLPKGTLKTLYVNLSQISGDQRRQDNLEWAVSNVPGGTDNQLRLQTPEEADTLEFEVSSEGQEAAIRNAFSLGEEYKGHDFSDYDYMVFISKYSPDLNRSNANTVPDTSYTSQAVASIALGNLGPARANALSELLMPLQNADDVSSDLHEKAAGTLYGRPLDFNHETGYVKTLLYGPDGNKILMAPEDHIGKMTMNTPLNTIIKMDKLILPRRQ